MASAMQTPKSILKKTTSYPTKAEEVALFHANLIQQRKNLELEILLSTEKLIDYPLARVPFDASNPSSADASSFKDVLRPFRTSDYDELITERNINDHCGYSLCPNPRLKDNNTGKYRLLGKNGKAKDFRVVEKAELEKWCSAACAKRALYVRLQLSETPAWERQAAEYGNKIDLLDEPKSVEKEATAAMEALHIGEQPEGWDTQNAANLALERGDPTGKTSRSNFVEIKIQEKDVERPPQPPSMDEEDLVDRLATSHLTLEGYNPVFGSQRQRRHSEEEGGSNTDWRI